MFKNLNNFLGNALETIFGEYAPTTFTVVFVISATAIIYAVIKG